MRRTWSCTVCGRIGRRGKFWFNGGAPICRDEEKCYLHFKLGRAIEAIDREPEEWRQRAEAEKVRLRRMIGDT